MALLQGSFRKIEFQINSHDYSGGRRKQDHEFPQRDVSRSEDLGRSIRTFSLDMFVIGDDVEQKRNALLLALEQEGPGELIHPFLGRKFVQVGGFSLTEDNKRRVASFSVEFTETQEAKFPVEGVDSLAVALDKAIAVQDASKAAFADNFTVDFQPSHVELDAIDKLKAVGDSIDTAMKKVTEPVANLTYQISNFKAAVTDLINKPAEIAQILEDTFNAFTAEFEDEPETNQRIMASFVTDFAPYAPVTSTTSSAAQNQANNDAIYGLCRQQVLSVQSNAAINSDFISSNSAVTIRDRIISEFDLELESTNDDDLFQSIKDMQTALAKALPPDLLGELITFTPPKTMPAIVIVHELFEDLEKEDELLEQNSVKHPAFVAGGELIEVSSG